MREQQTIGREISLSGVGLHSGARLGLHMRPSSPGSGRVFVSRDGKRLPALQQFRAPMLNATRLRGDGMTVDTPEHLLAALFCLGIDNVEILLDGGEVPILDGSSLPFAYAALDAGIVAQGEPLPTVVVSRPVSVEDDGRRLEILPGLGLRLTAAIDFEHEHLGYQDLTVRLDDPEDFLAKLAPARTFTLHRDVERLRRAGLIRGGSLDNAVVVGDRGVIGGELRFPDEFVRHKLLDLVGDLALLGCGLSGRLVAWRTGHALHGRLVDAILADRAAWAFEGPGAGPPSAPMPPGEQGGG